MRMGLVAGTILYGTELFGDAVTERVETPFGSAVVVLTDKLAYVPRHGLDEERYVLPHHINHQANFHALKSFGVKRVVALNSSGSLKKSLPPGTIIVPDDFISLTDVTTIFTDQPVHITPVLPADFRRRLIEAAEKAGLEVVDGGVYWQSRGPRLETKAEIKFISQFADCIGMTMGSEATVAQELGLEYASLCSVDNYGHGLSEAALTEEQIREGAKNNRQKMLAIFEELVGLA